MYSSGESGKTGDDRHEMSLEDLEPCLIREYDEFSRYVRRWITFWPKKPYNTKKGYDRGFIQAKTKKGNLESVP